MGKKLCIAITADPELPVPPKLYGGIERVVHMLICGLVERGHEVTLFAHPDSQVPCRLEPYPGRNSRSKADILRNMWHISSKVLRGRFDIVHSFGRLAYLLPLLPSPIPKIMTYQRAITPRSVRWAQCLARATIHFTGCSRALIREFIPNGNWHVVYNGVPAKRYAFRGQVPDDAPLVFLGRIEEIKGVHLAIEVALHCSRKLVIAGNIPNGDMHHLYFESQVAPHIDGRRIEYIGPVTDAQKNELLGSASALLMPVLWEEPFGIVMVEALACGTPVIGLNRGAVPEVVQSGINGFVCESVEEMIEAVQRIHEIDRKECRRIMEEKFSDRAIVTLYENLYGSILKIGSRRL